MTVFGRGKKNSCAKVPVLKGFQMSLKKNRVHVLRVWKRGVYLHPQNAGGRCRDGILERPSPLRGVLGDLEGIFFQKVLAGFWGSLYICTRNRLEALRGTREVH